MVLARKLQTSDERGGDARFDEGKFPKGEPVRRFQVAVQVGQARTVRFRSALLRAEAEMEIADPEGLR
jgi:hypothetical protein